MDILRKVGLASSMCGAIATLSCGAPTGDEESVLGASRAALTFNAVTRENFTNGGVQANDISLNSFVSGNGRFVTFSSFSNNLVAGDTNGVEDVYLHDRQTGFITLESRSSAGVIGNGDSRLS